MFPALQLKYQSLSVEIRLPFRKLGFLHYPFGPTEIQLTNTINQKRQSIWGAPYKPPIAPVQTYSPRPVVESTLKVT